MRILALFALALLMTGCASRGGGLPKPLDPLLQSKVDDTSRNHIHSVDPGNDQY
jgi:hypothetical protein